MDSYPVVAGSDIENGLEGEPDDAGGVHGESDELGLVEVLGALPRLEGVDSAEDDEDAVVGEWHEHAGVPAVALEGDHVSPLRAHLLPNPWHLHQQPDKSHQQLARDKSAADRHLGGGADEARPLGSIFHAAEDTSDTVGLGKESWVAHCKGGAQAESAQGANSGGRFGDVDEGHEVAHQHSQQEDVREFTATRFNHRRLVVLEEQAHHWQSAQYTKAGDGDRPDGPGILPADVFFWQIIAAGQVSQRPLTEAAVCTGELVLQVLVWLAGDTDPAAHISGLHTLHLVLPAGVAALGGGRWQATPVHHAVVQGQVVVPVADLLVDELPVLFVVMKDVVAADAVAESIEAHHALCFCRSEWSWKETKSNVDSRLLLRTSELRQYKGSI